MMAGALGWSPKDFASATPRQLYEYYDGWRRARGLVPDEKAGDGSEDPLTRNQIRALARERGYALP